jgi:hypothetical protein
MVCRPKKFGGLGVMHLGKYATALRLRWSWFEWTSPDKIWVGLGNPCPQEDMDIFYTATSITIGNGRKTPFWQAPWFDWRKPIEIAPLILPYKKGILDGVQCHERGCLDC